jgi:hypothetical protein
MVQSCCSSAPLGPNDAEILLARLEDGLPLALELEQAHHKEKGQPHPIWEAPAAGLYALAQCLKSSRSKAEKQRDIPAV